MEEEDDEHLCIKCRNSFVGLDNYISHRKKGCNKIIATKNTKQDESNKQAAGSSKIIEDDSATLNSKADNSYLHGFDENDVRQNEFEKPTIIETQILESLLNEKSSKNTETSCSFEGRKIDSAHGPAGLGNATPQQSLENSTKIPSKTIASSTSSSAVEEFNRLYDPMFHNEASVTSFLKSFENFAEPNKLADAHILFPTKENYYLESQPFEQRYPDLYNPLGQDSQDNQEQVNKSTNYARQKESTNRQNQVESQILKTRPKEIKQDDFLSSLELSSVKVVNEKRKFGFDDDYEDYDEDFDQRPPGYHTGGKWKPGMEPPPSLAGKWPPFSTGMNEESAEVDEDEQMSVVSLPEIAITNKRGPKFYTKGKWLPGKRPNKISTTSLYHCDTCNVNLKTVVSYKRHLQSRMHIKNCPEAQIEIDSRPSRPMRSKKLKAKTFLKQTIANLNRKKSIAVDKTHKPVCKTNSSSMKTIIVQKNTTDNLHDLSRNGEKINKECKKIRCPICKLSFGKAYFVNHYGSLAHIHNELELRKNKKDEDIVQFREIVLMNIDILISNCNFYCNDCKFFCNLQDDFNQHLSTHEEHRDKNSLRIYSCSACPDSQMNNISEMTRHMETLSHKSNAMDEIMAARKVFVQSKHYFPCKICNEKFKFNRQLENHRRIHHQQKEFKVSKSSPRLCPICPYKDNSVKNVRKHIATVHKEMPSYMCFLCGTKYDTEEEVKIHRYSREHRTKSGILNSQARCCRYCYTNFNSTESLRQHVSSEHQNNCIPCMKCGFIPSLKAELRLHRKKCKGNEKFNSAQYEHKCDLCSFSSPLLANVLTHTLLIHGERNQSDSRSICQVCKKTLKLSSARRHMLYHTREFPYTCRICCRSFPQELWLQKHLHLVHATSDGKNAKFLCQHCGNTFVSRSNLGRHQEETSCTGNFRSSICKKTLKKTVRKSSVTSSQLICELCGKEYQTPRLLKAHLKEHKNKNDIMKCPKCPYESHSLPHIRRHLRLHSGVKPYKCPHCSYRANNQENLRRHMKSQKHPGRCLYECKFCNDSPDQADSNTNNKEELSTKKTKDQPTTINEVDSEQTQATKTQGTQKTKKSKRKDQKGNSKLSHSTSIYKTNLASEFRQHLEENHRSEFQTSNEMMRCIRSYYDFEEDNVSYADLFSEEKKSSADSSQIALEEDDIIECEDIESPDIEGEECDTSPIFQELDSSQSSDSTVKNNKEPFPSQIIETEIPPMIINNLGHQIIPTNYGRMAPIPQSTEIYNQSSFNNGTTNVITQNISTNMNPIWQSTPFNQNQSNLISTQIQAPLNVTNILPSTSVSNSDTNKYNIVNQPFINSYNVSPQPAQYSNYGIVPNQITMCVPAGQDSGSIFQNNPIPILTIPQSSKKVYPQLVAGIANPVCIPSGSISTVAKIIIPQQPPSTGSSHFPIQYNSPNIKTIIAPSQPMMNPPMQIRPVLAGTQIYPVKQFVQPSTSSMGVVNLQNQIQNTSLVSKTIISSAPGILAMPTPSNSGGPSMKSSHSSLINQPSSIALNMQHSSMPGVLSVRSSQTPGVLAIPTSSNYDGVTLQSSSSSSGLNIQPSTTPGIMAMRSAPIPSVLVRSASSMYQTNALNIYSQDSIRQNVTIEKVTADPVNTLKIVWKKIKMSQTSESKIG